MSQFAEHYKNVHDEELIELALRGGLVEEAEHALQAELSVRGIHDLSAYAATRDSERHAQEVHRTKQLEIRTRSVTWRTRMLYAIAAFGFLYGVFLFARFEPGKSSEDGGIVMVVGVAIALFAFASGRISNFLNTRVLHRRPPE